MPNHRIQRINREIEAQTWPEYSGYYEEWVQLNNALSLEQCFYEREDDNFSDYWYWQSCDLDSLMESEGFMDPEESEYDIWDYREKQCKADEREEMKEWAAEWQMLEPSMRHETRRQRTEQAKNRHAALAKNYEVEKPWQFKKSRAKIKKIYRADHWADEKTRDHRDSHDKKKAIAEQVDDMLDDSPIPDPFWYSRIPEDDPNYPAEWWESVEDEPEVDVDDISFYDIDNDLYEDEDPYPDTYSDFVEDMCY